MNNGKQVKIIKINTRAKIKQKLEKLGVVKGVSVVVIRKAPLGDPIQIMIRGFYLAIRVFDAEKIVVEAI